MRVSALFGEEKQGDGGWLRASGGRREGQDDDVQTVELGLNILVAPDPEDASGSDAAGVLPAAGALVASADEAPVVGPAPAAVAVATHEQICWAPDETWRAVSMLLSHALRTHCVRAALFCRADDCEQPQA